MKRRGAADNFTIISASAARDSEAYLHPASRTIQTLAAATPGSRYKELAALLSPAVRRCVTNLDIHLISYSDLVPAR